MQEIGGVANIPAGLGMITTKHQKGERLKRTYYIVTGVASLRSMSRAGSVESDRRPIWMEIGLMDTRLCIALSSISNI
jgi:hypothetical protein